MSHPEAAAQSKLLLRLQTLRDMGTARTQRTLRKCGLDVRAYLPSSDDVGRRVRLITSRGVDLVLDVGAAHGRYGRELRERGYAGRIVSFEPMSRPFAQLEGQSADDPRWSCVKTALGSSDGETEINVAGNSDSSSILEMAERHRLTAPGSAYVATETVRVRSLDSIWDELADGAERPFLKLDVQGYELEVLRGAAATLPKLAGVQAELSLVPLYEGAPLFGEVIAHLEDCGMRLAGLEPGFHDPETGELLQADGLFVRD